MRLDLESTKPIYIQISEGIEDDILNGILKEGERAYSQYQVASDYNINPATAGKGIKVLEQEGILFKKRGLGMFVEEGAKIKILEKRKTTFKTDILLELLKEAKKLGINKAELKDMIDLIPEVE